MHCAKAYLSILFFDERFKFIEEGSTTMQVSQAGGSNASLTLPNIKAPKNGFAYVYVSNESDEMVYFDNLQVAHNRGRIIEENHYHAYGLKIAGISSKKLGEANYEGYLENKNLYNDKELIDEADLNWYDYGFRNYDPQIGRFPQLDPLTDDYPYYTPYQYAGNEPIANVDLDGLEPLSTTGVDVVVKTIVKRSAQTASTGATVSKALSIASIATQAAKITTNVINDKLRQSGIAIQCVKCHPDNTYIQKDFERIQNEYSKLDQGHGQVDIPRNKIWDVIDGSEIITDGL